MLKRLVRLLLLLVLPVSAASQSSATMTMHEWESIDNYSVESLIRARVSGAVILSGNCQHAGDVSVVSAGFIHDPPAKSPADLNDAMNFLVTVQPQIKWSFQPNGIVHIVDSRASGLILKSKVKRIEIVDAIDIQGAVDQLLSSPEVTSIFSQRHFRLMRNPSANRIFAADIDGTSSASSSSGHSLLLKNVTLENALDRIAEDFSGAWVYCECPGIISINSYQTNIPKFWRRHQ